MASKPEPAPGQASSTLLTRAIALFRRAPKRTVAGVLLALFTAYAALIVAVPLWISARGRYDTPRWARATVSPRAHTHSTRPPAVSMRPSCRDVPA